MTEEEMVLVGDEHPDAAAYVDLRARVVTLNCGAQVPVTSVRDEDGEEVEEGDYDLYDDLAVIFGPTPSGMLMLAHVARGFVGQLSGSYCESYAS